MNSDSEDETAVIAFAAASTVILHEQSKIKKRRKRKIWVTPWLLERSAFGVYDTLLQKMRLNDIEGYKNYLRMTEENFLEILALVREDIEKQNTVMRESIPADIKLAATIRYMATGKTYTESQYDFRIDKSSFSLFIPKVCDAIYKRLKDQYLKVYFLFIIYFLTRKLYMQS